VVACTALAWPDASPLVPGERGRHEGAAGWAWAFLLCAGTALLLYAVALALLARRGARLAAVVALAAGIQLAPLAAPLLLSSDAWTYWAYGRIGAVHGANPYADPPSRFPADPAARWVGGAWADSTSVYGPAFTLASEPLALVAGESRQAAAWLYKVLAAAAMLAATLLAARLSPRPAFAAAFVGWNPVLALHFAGGGHNDAWIAALVLAALALAAAHRSQAAGVCWSLSVLVKWVPLLFLPLIALAARRQPRLRLGWTGLAAASGLVVALALWRYGTAWLGAFGPLAADDAAGTRFALPERLVQAGVPRPAAVGGFALAFAAAYLWLLHQAWRGRARLGLAAALLLLAVPYLTPWYLAWAVPLAAAEDDEPAQWLALGLTAYLLPQTVPI
jgi:hypothetical protein